MKNHWIAITFLLLISESVHSQVNENRWFVEIGVNSINTENFDKSGYRIPSLSLSRYIFSNISVGISYSENEIESNEDLYYYSLDGIIKYNIPTETKIIGIATKPYIYLGYGLSNFGESDINFASKNTSYGPSYGLGIDFQISKNIALNTGLSYKSLNEKNAYSNLQHVVGIKFNFGKGDSDGDGVPDKKDKCPDHPGLTELNGCPDSDGDGINDLNDICPNSPGSSSQKGCPDSDGDGVNDNLDNCPNERGLKSNGGCKLPDLDKDGIPNLQDNCPNESVLLKYNGCPKLPNSLSFFLTNHSEFFFKFDSHKLSIIQKEKLYNLSKILSQYKYVKINVDGHASFEGDSIYNILLSKKRSNSIKNSLIDYGIDYSRINARGYGEEVPRYQDTPLSERRKNRRAVISINLDH